MFQTDLSHKKASDSRYDLLKFLLAMMIVALHTRLWPSVLLPWLRVAVPLFFMVSGYFFFHKIDKLGSTREQWAAMGHFAVRSAKLYLIWLAVWSVPTFETHAYFQHGFLFGIGKFCFDLLFGQTFAASWFLSANILGTLLVFIMRKRKWLCAAVSLGLYAVCVMTAVYGKALPEFTGALSSALPGYTFYFSFPAAMLWLWLASMIAKIPDGEFRNPLPWIVLTLIGIVLLYGENHLVTTRHWVRDSDVYASLAILCPAVFMAVRTIPRFTMRHSLSLRHASVIIYCTHATVAKLLIEYFKTQHTVQPQLGVYTFIITALVSALFCTAIILAARRWRYFNLAY